MNVTSSTISNSTNITEAEKTQAKQGVDTLNKRTVSETESTTINPSKLNQSAKALTDNHTDIQRKVTKNLEKVYAFESTDAKNVGVFVDTMLKSIDKQINVLHSADPDLKYAIDSQRKALEGMQKKVNDFASKKLGFLSHLKTFLSKIFHGKAYLQERGNQNLSTLRDMLTGSEVGWNFLKSFIAENKDNEEAMRGMLKVFKNNFDQSDRAGELISSLKDIDEDGINNMLECFKLNSLTSSRDKLFELNDFVNKKIAHFEKMEDFTQEKVKMWKDFGKVFNVCLDVDSTQKEDDFYLACFQRLTAESCANLKDLSERIYKGREQNVSEAKYAYNEFKMKAFSNKEKVRLLDICCKKIDIERGKLNGKDVNISDIRKQMKSLSTSSFLNIAKEGGFISEMMREELTTIIHDKSIFTDKNVISTIDFSENGKVRENFVRAYARLDKVDLSKGLEAYNERQGVSTIVEQSQDSFEAILEMSDDKGFHQIANDVVRGFEFNIEVGNSTLKISGKDINAIKENTLSQLNQLSCSDQQKSRLVDFLLNFPSQGIFATSEPCFWEGDSCPKITVTIKDEETSILVNTKGVVKNRLLTNFKDLLTVRVSPQVEAEVNFVYKQDASVDGRATEISVHKFNQTWGENSITFG